ncbi:hypothetical protein ACFL0D_06930 [Thermoproteota archaeon]
MMSKNAKNEWCIQRSRENLVYFWKDEIQTLQQGGKLPLTSAERKRLQTIGLIDRLKGKAGRYYQLTPLGLKLLRKAMEGEL